MRQIYIFLLLFSLNFWSCKCEPVPVDPVTEITQNPNPPQNNNLMQNVQELGQGSLKSIIYEMTTRSDGNFYAQGVLDYGGNTTSVEVGGTVGVINSSFEQVVHLLNPTNASTVSAARPGFVVSRCATIPTGNYPQSDYLLLTGEVTVNNAIYGKIMVYDKNGVYKTNFVTPDSVVLKKALLLSDLSDRLRFVVAGYNTKDHSTGGGYPEIATFDILKSNNTITNYTVVKRFTNYINCAFYDIERTQNGFFVHGGGGSVSVIIAHLDMNYNPIWMKSFQYNNEKTSTRYGCITTDGTNIIVAGTTEDPSKGTPGNGGKWDSGFVAVFDGATGNVIWQKIYSNLSKTSEGFYEVKYVDNKIVVGGDQAGVCYNYTGHDNCFSNGFIASINPTNGDIIKSYTFGDASYMCTINSIIELNNKLCIGGCAKGTSGWKTYKAWLFQIDKSNL